MIKRFIFILVLTFSLSGCSSFDLPFDLPFNLNTREPEAIIVSESEPYVLGEEHLEAVDKNYVDESVSVFEHVIGSGETLGAIANWYTGKTSNWEEIQEFNPLIDPNKLEVGQLLLIPMYLVIREDPLPKKINTSNKNRKNKKQKVNVKSERELLLEELLE